MQKQMVEKHTSHHRLTYGNSANADTRVMAALRPDLALPALLVDGAAGCQDRTCRFDSKARNKILARRNPAKNASRMVREEMRLPAFAFGGLLPADLIGILDTRQSCRSKSITDLDTLHGIDRHQGSGEIGIELPIDRRAKTDRHAACHQLDHRTDRVAVTAELVQPACPILGGLRIRRPERVPLDLPQSQRARSIRRGPIWTMQPRIESPGASTSSAARATPPAATRAAVSRAEERPPPR